MFTVFFNLINVPRVNDAMYCYNLIWDECSLCSEETKSCALKATVYFRHKYLPCLTSSVYLQILKMNWLSFWMKTIFRDNNHIFNKLPLYLSFSEEYDTLLTRQINRTHSTRSHRIRTGSSHVKISVLPRSKTSIEIEKQFNSFSDMTIVLTGHCHVPIFYGRIVDWS